MANAKYNLGIYMNKIFYAEEIPGMIEPVEQELLYNLAKNIELSKGSNIVEFGTFFGRSTACISAGLISNPSYDVDCNFFAYDSFECDLNGGFYRHVHDFASRYKVDHLIEKDGNLVNFLPVFKKYLGEYIDQGILEPQKVELINSFPKCDKIKLMHIDSPKYYSEFKYVLFRFFPLLEENSFVVFQDFFYHWSATLIAAVGSMLKRGFLSIEKSAASSLVCTLNKPISIEQLNEIDLELGIKANIPALIDTAISKLNATVLDRSEIFKPRLNLAKIQWFFESNQHAEAADEIKRFFVAGNKLNNALVYDFLELMSNGFSIRELYEEDHKQ